MSNKWCLVGAVSGDILTFRDKALVHENKQELEYLFPANRVVPLPAYWEEELTFPLKDHPDMDTVQFPLAQHMDQFQ
jgi:hypothetical protein